VSRVALLDVNLLVALFDPDHIHHDLAHDWFADNRADGWATCPTTENGLVRVLTHPKYDSPLIGVPAVLDRLRTFRASGHHHFWQEDLTLTDPAIVNPSSIRGHRQVTDVYLLGLALRRGGRLVTFDRSIPLAAVHGAGQEVLEVVGPVIEE
jgi:toxin-antitoxin system PIN domain toxin